MNDEIRRVIILDNATRIPVILIRPGDEYQASPFWSLAGYGDRPSENYVLMATVEPGGYESMEINYDPYEWKTRTLMLAHKYFQNPANWPVLPTATYKLDIRTTEEFKEWVKWNS